MRADESPLELDALGAKGLQNEFMRLVKVRLWKGGGAQAILVGHHDEPESAPLQLVEGRKNTGQKTNLLHRIDLLVVRLLDQCAVAINEQGWNGGRHCQASRSRLFCSGVPTLMRSA